MENYNRIYSDGTSSSTSTTTEIKPFENSFSGVTYTPDPVIPGVENDDMDDIVLMKLLRVNPDLKDYLMSKNAKTYGKFAIGADAVKVQEYAEIAFTVIDIIEGGRGLVRMLKRGGSPGLWRSSAGTARGSGKNISGNWLRGSAGNAGVVPQSVASKLSGRSFGSFNDFRSAFWKSVGNDPKLTTQFSNSNITRMQQGLAPYVHSSQQVGKTKRSYELHHRTPIQHGGGVYDLDNIMIVTPRYHQEVLSPLFHYGNG